MPANDPAPDSRIGVDDGSRRIWIERREIQGHGWNHRQISRFRQLLAKWRIGFWQDQAAYEAILGQTWRIVAGSFAAFLADEFANAIVLMRLKRATEGRFLWTRTIGSTIVGQAIDSAIFISIAFGGREGFDLWPLMWKQWLFKVVFETIATPLTYAAVTWLKRAEGIDAYDDEDLSPIPLPFGRAAGR